MSSYKKSFKVNRPPDEVFRVITTEMSDWWSETSNRFVKVGDTAKVTFEGMKTYWVFRAIELNAPTKVVLECVDSHHVHTGESEAILTEWLNTKLVFELVGTNNGTQINFTHEGLTPDLKCHKVCKEGWDHFVGESLREYLSP